MLGFQFILLVSFTLLAFIFDVWQMRIPNWLNILGSGLGLVYHTLRSGLDGFVYAAVGMLGLFCLALLLYLFKAIGGGDVKWYAALGAICGFFFSFYAFLCAIFLAGLIALFYIAWDWGAVFRSKRQIPFMYAAFPAVWVAYFTIF